MAARSTSDPERWKFRLDIGRLYAGANNLLGDLFGVPEFKAMYLRRMRTVMDELFQPPGTPGDERALSQRIDELAEQLAPDVAAEFAAWPSRGAVETWPEQIELFKNEYFERRRVFLYGLVGDMDFSGTVDRDDIDDFVLGLTDPAAYEARYGVHPSLRGDTDFDVPWIFRILRPGREDELVYDRNMALDFDDIPRFIAFVNGTRQHAAPMPPAQVGVPEIEFGEIDFDPVSGNQDEEFIELSNPHAVAVDISGWRLEGGVEYQFKPGVVIPPRGSLYVTPNFNAFRARQTGPSGGQGLFVQGDYTGHLSNLGATVRLVAADGTLVGSVTTPSAPSPAQASLRISEIMIHDFSYDDGWYQAETDGGGYSLELIDPAGTALAEWGNQSSWRVSATVGGSPGTDGLATAMASAQSDLPARRSAPADGAAVVAEQADSDLRRDRLGGLELAAALARRAARRG